MYRTSETTVLKFQQGLKTMVVEIEKGATAEILAASFIRLMIRSYESGVRGECPLESAELKTFFNKIRREYPDTWGRLAFHPRNEGKKSHAQVTLESMEGATTGAVDIIIPGRISFVCELKRQVKSKSRVSMAEWAYLKAAMDAGAFACVAYGWEQAWRAFNDYLEAINDD